jgi:acyl carrier protein
MTEAVIRSWQSVLGHEVGPDEDLFQELSASSLEILELLEAMSEDFGVHLTVNQLYDNPTPRALAKVLAQGNVSEA